MRIRFETTIDDVVAFNLFHFAHSPAWRRQVWTNMLLVPGILLFLLVLTYLSRDPLEDEPLFLAVYGGVFAIISIGWIIGIRWFLNRSLAKNTRRFLAEGSNRALFGWRELELVDNRLLMKSELIDSSMDLRAVEKIMGNENYTYVYIGSTSAYVIPMNLYPEEEYREFVAELREAWDNREAPRPMAREADARIAEKPL